MLYEVYIIPFPALLGIALLLTDIDIIQNAVLNVASIVISFGKSVRLTLVQLFLGLASARFAAQCFMANHAKNKLNLYRYNVGHGQAFVSSEIEDRLKANVWRSDRNWWICLLGIFCWLTFVRMSQVLEKLKYQRARASALKGDIKSATRSQRAETNLQSRRWQK